MDITDPIGTVALYFRSIKGGNEISSKPLIRDGYLTTFNPTLYIWHSMTISYIPLVLPPSADASRFKDFGREVKGVHPGTLTQGDFKEIERALLKVWIFLSICFKLIISSMIYSYSEM